MGNGWSEGSDARTVGRESAGSQECLFLNRVARITGTEDAPRVAIEPDARHVEVVLNDLGVSWGNSVTTPSIKVTA